MEDIKKFYYLDNYYYCDKHGNIYNKEFKKLKTRVNNSRDGYLTVSLWGKDENGCKKVTGVSVHKIVAELFIPKPDDNNLYEVNHKDFDRTNPDYENLEWVTHSDNIKYSIKAGRHFVPDWSGTKNPKSKLKEEDIYKIIDLYNSGMRIRDIKNTNMFNVSETRIGQIISDYKKSQTTIQ